MKNILIICSCLCLLSCKVSHPTVNNKMIGIAFQLPKGADLINPEILADKHSNKFYWDGGKRDYTYQINEDVIIGFSYYEDPYPFENVEKDMEQFTRAVRYNTTDKVQKVGEEIISRRLFRLCFYKAQKNDEDYFVLFRSDGTKTNWIAGVIRFPAGYSQEEIEKQTVKILSGIKFTK